MRIGITDAEFEELRILAIRQGTTAPKLIAEQIRKLLAKRPKGAQVSEQQLASFEKGKTTYAQVVANLGQPTSQTTSSEGSRIATWTYFESKARASTFIPIVGPFVGGADSRSNVVQMRFDQAGILEGYTDTASQFGSGTGFASGVHSEPVEDQPRQAP